MPRRCETPRTPWGQLPAPTSWLDTYHESESAQYAVSSTGLAQCPTRPCVLRIDSAPWCGVIKAGACCSNHSHHDILPSRDAHVDHILGVHRTWSMLYLDTLLFPSYTTPLATSRSTSARSRYVNCFSAYMRSLGSQYPSDSGLVANNPATISRQWRCG